MVYPHLFFKLEIHRFVWHIYWRLVERSHLHDKFSPKIIIKRIKQIFQTNTHLFLLKQTKSMSKWSTYPYSIRESFEYVQNSIHIGYSIREINCAFDKLFKYLDLCSKTHRYEKFLWSKKHMFFGLDMFQKNTINHFVT